MKENNLLNIHFTLLNTLILAMSVFCCLLLFNLTSNVTLTVFMLVFLAVLGYKYCFKLYQSEDECILDAFVILGLIVLNMLFYRMSIVGVIISSIFIFAFTVFDFHPTKDDVLSLMIALILVVIIKTMGAQSLLFILMLYGFKMINA